MTGHGKTMSHSRNSRPDTEEEGRTFHGPPTVDSDVYHPIDVRGPYLLSVRPCVVDTDCGGHGSPTARDETHERYALRVTCECC